MVGALSILRTTLFLTRTFVLVQPAKQSLASACYKPEVVKKSSYYHGSMVFNSYCKCP